MTKLRTEVIRGQSQSDVEGKKMEWQKRTAGKVSDVKFGPIKRIDWPQARESHYLGGVLGGMDTHQMIISYQNKPRLKTSRGRRTPP
jgi:hypothetical protein